MEESKDTRHLDVAIATWKPDGPRRFLQHRPPLIPGVRYVLSWQEHGNAPAPKELEEREDVEIFRTDCKGISANRNNAIAHCTAPIVLNGDDDVFYSREGMEKLIDAYSLDTEMDVAMCAYYKAGKIPAKHYPASQTNLKKMPRGLWAGAIELSFRRNSEAANLLFDTHYGPGAENVSSGEDEFWLLCARHRGLKCKFVPVFIGEHPEATTISRLESDPLRLHGQGGIIAGAYPRWQTCIRLLLKAWRVVRSSGRPFPRVLSDLVWGVRHLPRPY